VILWATNTKKTCKYGVTRVFKSSSVNVECTGLHDIYGNKLVGAK